MDGVPLGEVADMAAHLPPESSVHRVLNPNWMHSHDLELLRRIELHMQYLVWFKTRDGEKGRNRPEPYPFPWEDDQKSRVIDGVSVASDGFRVDELDALMGWS